MFHLSKVKEVSTRLRAIVEQLVEVGFSGMSFQQKQDFLRTLYPYRDKTYHISLIGRKPTPNERDLLMKYGLLDKVLWKDSDIKRAEAIIEFCNADLAFPKKSVGT